MRSTVLIGSIDAMRESPRWDEYVEALDAPFRETLLTSVAATWVPVAAAAAHYRACDALGLSKRDAWDIGVEVTQKVHGTSLALAIRLAKQAGVTPWTILAQLPRLWDRVWQGGGIAVYKHGPKEAVLEAIQWRLAGIPYVRYTMPAVVHGIVEMFCTKVYVTEMKSMMTETSLGMKLQWA
jgi:hypothetical protein